jgi:hypothetical protein
MVGLLECDLVLPGKLCAPVTVGLLLVLTAAFLRRAGAIRERRMTPNQKIRIPAHRCFSTCHVDGLGGLKGRCDACVVNFLCRCWLRLLLHVSFETR